MNASATDCPLCHDTAWRCEAHPTEPMGHDRDRCAGPENSVTVGWGPRSSCNWTRSERRLRPHGSLRITSCRLSVLSRSRSARRCGRCARATTRRKRACAPSTALGWSCATSGPPNDAPVRYSGLGKNSKRQPRRSGASFRPLQPLPNNPWPPQGRCAGAVRATFQVRTGRLGRACERADEHEGATGPGDGRVPYVLLGRELANP